MQDQWYGDKRDLVKWGVLLELTRRHRLKHILQVLYHRPSTWEQLEIDGEQVELPAAVVKHFRDATSISSMQCSARVEVVSEAFGDRNAYLQIVLQRIKSRAQRPSIVFLDPDTGLEPAGGAGLQHVLDSEVGRIWDVLSAGDVLGFYQHKTNRSGAPWIELKKLQFEQALQVRKGAAKIAWAPGISNDVGFFYIEKKGKTRVSSQSHNTNQSPQQVAACR
jgi:hypothetical protein